MFRPMHALAGIAVASLAIPVQAQMAKGSRPPEFAFEKVWNDCPATFAGLAGKVVVLDFAQTW